MSRYLDGLYASKSALELEVRAAILSCIALSITALVLVWVVAYFYSVADRSTVILLLLFIGGCCLGAMNNVKYLQALHQTRDTLDQAIKQEQEEL